jgi:hypothetical protein
MEANLRPPAWGHERISHPTTIASSAGHNHCP